MAPPIKTKASFVIPAYNSQDTISEAITSCLQQSEKGVEVIVVDDGSTDHTAKVINYHAEKDSRVKPVYLAENRGRSLARNAGIEKTTGSIIFTLDADDIAVRTRVADTFKALKKNPTVDVFYGHFHVINELGQIMDLVESKPFDFDEMKSNKDMWLRIGHSTVAFKKEVFGKVQYTDGEYSSNAIDDWKFCVDAHKSGFKFMNIPAVLARYRYTPKQRDEEKIKELKLKCL